MDENGKVLVDEASVPLDGDDVVNEDSGITQPFNPSEVRVETKNTQMDALIKRIRNGEINLAGLFLALVINVLKAETALHALKRKIVLLSHHENH